MPKTTPPPPSDFDDFDSYINGVVFDEEAEEPMELPPTSIKRQRSKPLSVPPVDLTNEVKVVFAVGRGNTGKSVISRKLAEDGGITGTMGFIAACDPGNRSLPMYVNGVKCPPTSDPVQTSQWIMNTFSYLKKNKIRVALYDMGASGDNALSVLIETIGDLDAQMRQWGLTPVILYTIGPNIDDLVCLTTFEKRGFRPKATALVYNEGLVRTGEDKVKAFARVRLHPSVTGAVQRGAVETWMPSLDAMTMEEIERKRLLFRMAAAGETRTDRHSSPLGPFARARTTRWLAEVDYEFAPIRSWLS